MTKIEKAWAAVQKAAQAYDRDRDMVRWVILMIAVERYNWARWEKEVKNV